MTTKPRFEQTFCSNCGGEFGPGDNGFSHCENHASKPQKITQDQIDTAHALWLRKITASDVLDELAGAEATLQAAIQAGDAARIGRIFLAVRRNYALRLALQDVFSPKDLRYKSTEEVAAAVA